MKYKINNIEIPDVLPLIALKNTVLFPRVVIPLIVQRTVSVLALESAMAGDRLVMFVTQKNIEDRVTRNDVFSAGTIGRIVSVFKLPDGSFKLDVEGLARAKIEDFIQEQDYFKVRVDMMPEIGQPESLEEKALLRSIMDNLKAVSEMRALSPMVPEAIYMVAQIKDIEQIVSLIAVNLNLEVQDQQKILESVTVREALGNLNAFLIRELDILQAEEKVTRDAQKRIGKFQKETFLREQLKSIEKELGGGEEEQEFDVMRKKIESAGMPDTVRDKAIKELNRLAKMPPFSPEVSFLRTYLDWLIELPWSTKTHEKINLKESEKILNEDHYGLQKVKERIIEYLAVKKQAGKLKGPILCLVGPPGTGKTSIGQSIARSLERKFVRMSLGGIRDEAEIRGHRRTYIGALPGRIIQGIHNAKYSNPVFMLDEIDKIGMDFRGDPSSALLEALDPNQNFAFSDHYLEVPFDLSDVFFIATANTLETIPPALLDRMEIIEFPGYSEDEKFHIAKNFLIPKLLKDHGLTKKNFSLQDSALTDVIQNHTREAGVRELDRQLAAVIRKVTREIVEKNSKKLMIVSKKDLHKYLGPAKYTHQMGETKDEIGIVTGLGWTPVGGEVFAIEATKMPGKGNIVLTGRLGEVMKESAQAALSFARAYASDNDEKDGFYKMDIHVHVPSGAIKKDGPSAGIALTTALVSLLTGKKVRKEVCMTGEVTLRGKVLEIGGVKEKVLAAHRAGLKVVIMPAFNKKDLQDIPKEVARDIKFVFVKTMDEVLKAAFR